MSVYNLVDSSWEVTDPNPDIFALFVEFNNAFFDGQLGCVEVKWSKRMTLCAGLCRYAGRAGCTVVLSEPLLKLRPRRDLIETLLHEMIHAFLFVAEKDRQRESHGPSFVKHMRRINALTGTNITVYHSFHDEVNFYKVHVWQCSGPCKSRAPYYGKVSRSMNRAPGPSDFWHKEHQLTCGGTFNKISGPDPQKKPPSVSKKGIPKLPSSSNAGPSLHQIDKYFPPVKNDKPTATGRKVPPSATYTPTAAASNHSNYLSGSSLGSASIAGPLNRYIPNNSKENKGNGRTGENLKLPSKSGSSTGAGSGSRVVEVVTLDDDDDFKYNSGSGNTLNSTNYNSSRPSGLSKKPEDHKPSTFGNSNLSPTQNNNMLSNFINQSPSNQIKKPENNMPSNFINQTSSRSPSQIKTAEDSKPFKPFVPFSGKGYALGGGGSGGQPSGCPSYKKPRY